MLRVAQSPCEQQGAFVELSHFRRAVALRGHQHRAKRDQQFQLLLIAPDGLRKVAAKHQRPAQQVSGLGIGVAMASLLRRFHVVVNRRFGDTCGFVVGSQPAADRFLIRRVKLLQSHRDTAVQEAPAYRAEFGVGDLAKTVVGEIVLGHAVRLALALDEAALPQFV